MRKSLINWGACCLAVLSCPALAAETAAPAGAGADQSQAAPNDGGPAIGADEPASVPVSLQAGPFVSVDDSELDDPEFVTLVQQGTSIWLGRADGWVEYRRQSDGDFHYAKDDTYRLRVLDPQALELFTWAEGSRQNVGRIERRNGTEPPAGGDPWGLLDDLVGKQLTLEHSINGDVFDERVEFSWEEPGNIISEQTIGKQYYQLYEIIPTNE